MGFEWYHGGADFFRVTPIVAPTQTRGDDEGIGRTTAPNRTIRTRSERQVEITVSL